MDYPKISIVTPSFNDEKFLERTILSLIDQQYPNLEYIVIDGGSSDGSAEIIKKYESKISYWESKKDDGMYHAIQRGFERSTGEIMGWINSDDKHQPGSLFTLAQVFCDHKEVEWIQGVPTVIDEMERIYTDSRGFEVDKTFFYSRKHLHTHKFIQQESTFWRRSLWVKAGGFVSTQYELAGDFELWIRFFKYAKLYQVNAILGSFRQTPSGQASIDHLDHYLEETVTILRKNPLSRKETNQLRYLTLLEQLHGCWVKWYLLLSNKLKTPSYFKEALYFDPGEQKIKKC